MKPLPGDQDPRKTVASSGRRSLRPDLPQIDKENYVLGPEVGRGGQGRILSARDRRLNRDIALKELIEVTPPSFPCTRRVNGRTVGPSTP